MNTGRPADTERPVYPPIFNLKWVCGICGSTTKLPREFRWLVGFQKGKPGILYARCLGHYTSDDVENMAW